MNGAWEVVIGLEIHAQLATTSKIFSAASTAYGAAPNTQACLVDLGYPGVLPVLNKEVVRMATIIGLAVNATVAPRSVFARKNYFYPDLPKGYQISQYELPIVEWGRRQTRSLCYVDDIVEGLVRPMETGPEITGPINLGNPHKFTVLDLAEMVRE